MPSLGARGGGWVVLQSLLLAGIVAAAVGGPRWPEGVARVLVLAGGLVALAGAVVVVRSSRALGRGLTPFPRPPADGALVTDGPYRRVRHPLYTGVILFAAGIGVAFSPLALALAGVLAVLFGLKARVEERFLREAYPDYDAYASRTRYRLVPFVY